MSAARMRLLALATHGIAGPSTRFRVLQWKPYLEDAGVALTLHAIFSAKMTAALYQSGWTMAKLAASASGAARRWATLARLPELADVLLIHREIFPLGRKPFWRVLERFPGPIIYDYDDAMFMPQRGDRGILRWWEKIDTPKAAMALSDVVLAGNEFLAAYARPHARRVVVLPTCIDTARFEPPARPPADGKPVVGWIGSYTASKYLLGLVPVLQAVAERVPFRLYVVGCHPVPPIHGVEIEQVAWSLAREVEDFQRCDVGVYPLWDDEWAKGKCAFKAIQFMACGAPVVASAVGMNRELIKDGVNGSLASTPEEWVEKLARLLADPALRARWGVAARQTVEESYSVRAHATTFIRALREAVHGHAQPGASRAEDMAGLPFPRAALSRGSG